MHNPPDLRDAEGSPRHWAGWGNPVRFVAVGCGALLAIGAVMGAQQWLADVQPPADQGVQSAVAFTCGFQVPKGAKVPAADRAYCERAAADYGRRLPLSDEQRRQAEAMTDAVTKAASDGGWCMGPMEPACLKRPPSHPPRPEDVDTARLWLAKTKASDSTARLARPDDPAPVGSLLYAARVGDACIVGHVGSIPGGGAYWIAGLLPGERCLSD
jgi:hypothetical protein